MILNKPSYELSNNKKLKLSKIKKKKKKKRTGKRS